MKYSTKTYQLNFFMTIYKNKILTFIKKNCQHRAYHKYQLNYRHMQKYKPFKCFRSSFLKEFVPVLWWMKLTMALRKKIHDVIKLRIHPRYNNLQYKTIKIVILSESSWIDSTDFSKLLSTCNNHTLKQWILLSLQTFFLVGKKNH